MLQEESNTREGRWGFGFGVALGMLALLAGWYVPGPRLSPPLPPPLVATGGMPTPQQQFGSLPPIVTSTATFARSTPAPSPTTFATPTPTLSPTPSATAALTGSETPAPVRSPATTIYVVQSGDTLYDIAVKFRVSEESIVRTNSLEGPDVLAEGQRLRIPAPEGER